MILVDTSIWINLLGPRPLYAINFEMLLSFATCPPIVQELLQGLPMDHRFDALQASVLALPCLSPSVAVDTYIHAAEIYRSGRKRGLTIRSSVDCLIAAIAIEQKVAIWHKDRDFDMIARFTDLECAAIKP
jgi:predicted nucleic acid-binding protein